MASIGHLAVGAAVGAAYSVKTGSRARPTILLFAGLALAPDLDLVTGFFGAQHGSPLDHRGFTHSILFAILMAGLAAAILKGTRQRRLLLGLFVLGALGSHGLLDTMSRQGNGPMLFWPFSTGFYEFPFRPIPGVLNAQSYLTTQAIPTLVVETLLFLPFLAYAFGIFFPVDRAGRSEKVLPEA
jgi:inner membrane protein